MDSPAPNQTPLAGTARLKPAARRGRASVSNAASRRFDELERVALDDGWDTIEEGDEAPVRTTVALDATREIIARNSSPDIPFDRSINPYRGCEHGCIYCFARPTHAYLGLSPGLDFETKLLAKPNAAKLLAQEISRPGYEVRPIALGTNTDPYQPIERRMKITRSVLEVLREAKHPLTIVTKSHLVTRDIDILAEMAEHKLVKVHLSVTTLSNRLARAMEPRASTPARRLAAISALAQAKVPVGAMIAPVIPALNDHELEWIIAAVADAGAEEVGHLPLRLPHEVKDLFKEWLAQHFPERAARVMRHIRDMRGGRENDPRFESRMRGEGAYAALIARRARVAAKKHGLNTAKRVLATVDFTPPAKNPVQLSLF